MMEIPNAGNISILLLKQASLVAAKNSLGAGDTTGRSGKLKDFLSSHYYDSDDVTSMDTPAGHAPVRFSRHSFGVRSNKEVNGGVSLLSHLTMKFEQRKQNFDNEIMAIINLYPGRLHSTNPADEYRRLKHSKVGGDCGNSIRMLSYGSSVIPQLDSLELDCE
ncbi:hypothetical protein T459_05097 [Capsicum annuum]|uniref:Uncharacterized protein n=1 Tax=Capsicum annuum TaxID=4072 RepID=A0A2G3A6X2_CAPAN|nr:hypothetical protein T459_05097 [Capsicum annuum]